MAERSAAGVVRMFRDDVVTLCLAALETAGADRRVAQLLTDAALFAEDRGKPIVGVAHLLDHVHALEAGRIDGRAVPELSHPLPALLVSDARGGVAHTGFDEGFGQLVAAARQCGLAAFAGRGSFPCGPLGWFTERLAQAGLVAVATAVSPAVMASGPGTGRVFGTNPLACSVPVAGRPPTTIDQACSATAFVSVREAASRGEPLPDGWAVDADGQPTTDAQAALAGALLPFGGYKGANIALLVELLSSMAGGNWSMDAPDWTSGSQFTSIGMFVLAIDHSAVDAAAPERFGEQLTRLAETGVRLPGGRAVQLDHLELPADLVAALRSRAG